MPLSDSPRNRPAGTALLIGLVAVILALPAILNGAPFLYFDSATYIAQGQAAVLTMPFGLDFGIDVLPSGREVAAVAATDQTPPLIVGGRSIYYGVLAYLTYGATQAWGLVLIQGLAVGFPLVILVRRFAGRRLALWSMGSAAALAFLTPAGVFVGMIMPDIWAGAMVLAVACLAIGGDADARPPPLWEVLALSGICLTAVLFHLSHLALLLALIASGLLAWPLWRGIGPQVRARLLLPLGASIAVGILGPIVFATVVERTYGSPPISRPHLTAHLVDMGPGTAYAREACLRDDAPPMAICELVDRLPMTWIEFLFDPDPRSGAFEPASDAMKRALAEDDLRFVAGTFLHDPVGVSLGLLTDGIAQLGTFSVLGVPITHGDATSIAESVPPALAEATRGSVLYRHPDLLRLPSTPILAALGLATLFAFFAERHLRAAASVSGRPSPIAVVTGICLAGIVLNAFVCGMLASPYPRFQARIVWLLPIAALLAVLKRSAAPIPEATRESRTAVNR